MPIAFPTRYPTWSKELVVGVELAAPGTVAAGRTYREVCRNISSAAVRDVEAVSGYLGIPAMTFDSQPFQVHDEGSFTVDFRNGGLAALSCLTILGVDTVSGAGPYTHTGTQLVASSNIPTMTIWESQGDLTNVARRTYATLTGVSLSTGPSGGVVCGVSYASLNRTYVAAPTPTVYVGSAATAKKTRQKGNAAVFNIYGGTGGTTLYTAKVLSMDIQISRGVGFVPNPNGVDPLDIVPGVIEASGSISYYYDGAGANTLVRDANAYNELGDSTHVHNVVWTDADTRTTTLSLYPLRFADVTPEDGDTYVIGTASFVAYNDMAQANQATPVLTSIQSIAIQNEYSLSMLGN